MLLCIVIGAALGLSNPLTLANVSDVSTDQTRSRVLALRLMFGFAAQAASPIVFSFVSNIAGLAPVFWGSGLIIVGCVVFSIRMNAISGKTAA